MKPRSSFFKKINKINKAQNVNIRHERVDITTEFVDILDIKRIRQPMQQMQGFQFNSCARKIPWNRKWQPTTVFLPAKSHGQRSLVGFKFHGVTKEWDMSAHAHTHTHPL